jgi:hypothetical protein
MPDSDCDVNCAIVIEIDAKFANALQNRIARRKHDLGAARGHSSERGSGSQGVKQQMAIKKLR